MKKNPNFLQQDTRHLKTKRFRHTKRSDKFRPPFFQQPVAFVEASDCWLRLLGVKLPQQANSGIFPGNRGFLGSMRICYHTL